MDNDVSEFCLGMTWCLPLVEHVAQVSFFSYFSVEIEVCLITAGKEAWFSCRAALHADVACQNLGVLSTANV